MAAMRLDFDASDNLLDRLRHKLPDGYVVTRVDERTFMVFNGQRSASETLIVDILGRLIRMGSATCVDTDTAYRLSDGFMLHRDIEVFNEDDTSFFV